MTELSVSVVCEEDVLARVMTVLSDPNAFGKVADEYHLAVNVGVIAALGAFEQGDTFDSARELVMLAYPLPADQLGTALEVRIRCSRCLARYAVSEVEFMLAGVSTADRAASYARSRIRTAESGCVL